MKNNEVLKNINEMLFEAEIVKKNNGTIKWYIDSPNVHEKLNIWDWYTNILTVAKLKQMKNFLETAEKLGFVGEAFFIVGKKGCSHGMWVYKKDKTKECLYHSFVNGQNYFDYRDKEYNWLTDRLGKSGCKIEEIRNILA